MFTCILSLADPSAVPAFWTWQFLRGLILLVVFVGVVVWLGYRSLKRSDEPTVLIVKWVASVVMGWVTLFMVGPIVIASPLIGVPLTAACGLVFAVIWRESIIAIISKPFTSLYDGGDVSAAPEPFYSLAIAKRKRGHYREAIAEIRAQLERFPADFQGQFLIAEILAEDLNDLPGADLSIQRLCNQKGHHAGSIAMALNTLADWQLKYAQDREAARRSLERIIEIFPESEFSALASQRIGHLASAEHLLSSHDRRRIVVKEGVQNMGLLSGDQHPKAPEADPAKQAAEYVAHLETHPLDTEAREKLAQLYAEHYGRLDLAADQLEQLIGNKGQPMSRVVHWLNLLADLQLEHGANHDTVRATLQRIVDLYPNAAPAGVAQSRIAHLKLEFRKKEKSQTVKLGSYEQDIGLKRSE